MPAWNNWVSPAHRVPSAAPCANSEDSCDEALADVKVEGMAHKKQSHSTGGQKWYKLSGTIQIASGEPHLTLTSPAAHCPIPAWGREGTGSWSSLQGSCFGTRRQQPPDGFVQRLLWSCMESTLLLISACHPLGVQPSLHLLLVVFGLQLCQWESLHTANKVLLE